jgi:hypothetical protein
MKAQDYLQDLMSTAIQAQADGIVLEQGPDGLEVYITQQGTGIGNVVQDRKLASDLIKLIVRRAGLSKTPEGKMIWREGNLEYTVKVEMYDSFGEWCFRLNILKGVCPKQKRAKPGKQDLAEPQS